jgi:hypothetical protein
MRTTNIALAGLILLGGSLFAKDAEDPVAVLTRVFANPPATGIVITLVAPESQAAQAGVMVGDIFVSYNGVATPDIPSLNAAKETVGDEQTEIEVEVVGPAGRRTIILAPGQIGVNGAPVVMGVPGGGLPADTGITFDFSRFAGEGVDEWFAFSLDGRTKVGFEHAKIKVAGGKLFLRREVAFDGGEEWGLNHFDVTVVASLSPAVDAVMTRFENPLTGWVGKGRLSRDETGKRIWVKQWPDLPEERAEIPGPLLPEYLVESLAALMPHQEGACFRYRPIGEGMGTVGLPSALVVRGQEEIEFGTGRVRTWKVEGLILGGGIGGTYWISEDGRTLKVSYGGAFGTRSTKEAVLSDLHPELKPRTAE